MSHRTHLDQVLSTAGYTLARSSKHLIYKHPEHPMVTVPNHNKMNENTYRSILKKVLKFSK